MSVEQDGGRSSTKRYVNKRYNFDNQLTFTSYPWSSTGYQLGIRYFYDGLKRKVRTEVDTKAGVKVSTATYLAGNRVSSEDFKNSVTRTTFLAYGAPAYQQPTEIVAPESVTTKMQYNVFGNMRSVVQGGVTQTNIYDTYQRLCKKVRPDEGNRAFSYNAIGQLSWHAHGGSVDGSLTSCDTVVDGLDKTTYIYDNLGNSYRVDYGDDTPDLTYKYDKNNNLKRLEAGATTWAYDYNSLNLVELETLSIDGKSFTLDPSYNSLGYLSSMVYPSGRSLSITANGLGQVTSVGGYITNATYYPGGSLDTITYGNGVTYSVDLNTRQLPEDAFIKKSDGTFLSNLYYGYDANANVELIQDYLKPRYTIDMEYDGLNRLVVANGYWGEGSFDYDVLGNIRSKKLGGHSLIYEYDTENRLYTVSGSKDYLFDYDSRGNVVENGIRPFTYNLANQLVKSDGLNYTYDGHSRRVKKSLNGKTSYSVYSTTGKLMYRQKDNGDHIDYLYLGNRLVTSIESR